MGSWNESRGFPPRHGSISLLVDDWPQCFRQRQTKKPARAGRYDTVVILPRLLPTPN